MLISLFVILSLLGIAYQDIRYQSISVFLFPLLLGFLLYLGLIEVSAGDLFRNSVINISFVLIQLVLITVYLILKTRSFINPVNTYLGLGDILFWVVISIAFSPVHFLLYFLFSLIIALLAHMVLRSLRISFVSERVPLAGYQALVFLLLFVFNLFYLQWNLLHDEQITQIFI